MILPVDIVSGTICGLTAIYVALAPWFKQMPTWQKLTTATLTLFCAGCCFSVQLGFQTFCIFAATAIVFAVKRLSFKLWQPMFWLLFAYFLWHVVSLIWTPDLSVGLNKLINYSLFLTIPLVFCCVDARGFNRDGVLTAFVRMTELYVLVALVCWIWQSHQLQIPLSDWFVFHKQKMLDYSAFDLVFGWFNYHHPTYNSICVLMGLTGAYWLLDHRWSFSRIHYLELIGLSVASLLLIIVVQSRTGLILWLMVGALGVGRLLYPYRKWFAVYVAMSVCGCLCFGLLKHDAVARYISDPIRQQNFETAFYFIGCHPVLGSGVEGIRAEMASHEVAHELGYPYAHVDFGNPHHQFVGDLMQTGVVGLLLVSVLMLWIAWLAYRQKSWMLGVFWLVTMVLMQIEMPFYLYKGTFIILFWLCFLTLPTQEKKLS